MIQSLVQDARYAIRALRRSPGFTLVAVLTLAFGIGATTTIFSVVDAVVLRPLPFHQPEQLVRIWETNPHGGDFSTSDATYLDFKEQNRSFVQMAAFSDVRRGMVLSGGCAEGAAGCDPVRLQSIAVTSSIFPLLGVSPANGRTFSAAEDQPGGDNRVVVIGHELWTRRFGADPRLVGSTIRLDGQSYTVVGIMPAEFDFPSPAELWVPLVLDPSRDRDEHDLTMIGRLGPGVTPSQASADMERVAREIGTQHPRTNASWSARVVSFSDWMIGPDLERAVFILLGAVGFLLLLACANIANLLIARGAARQGEVGIRAALGASSARLTRQFLTESVLLALIGAVVGLGVATWAAELLRAFGPADIPRLDQVSIDGRALGFTLLVTLSTSLLFGLTPAVQISSVELHSTLKHGTRGGTSRGRTGIRNAFVVVQVALAMMLLTGAGLLFSSFVRLQQVPLGFDASNVLTVPLQLPAERYSDERRGQFFESALTRIAGIPGVKSAGATSTDPLRGWGFSNDVTPEDRAAETSAGGYLQAGWRSVTPGFFTAMGIPLVQGRLLTEMDRSAGERPVVISRTMARQLWPGEDAVGKRLFWGGTTGTPRTVVGVVGDIRDLRLDADPAPLMFLPYGAAPVPGMTVVIRTTGDPASVAGAVRREIRALDRELPVPVVRPLNESRSTAVAQPRFRMLLLGGFATAALLLAAVGIYGMMAFTVAQRTREIGVRIALGAHAHRVFTLVLSQGMVLAAIGLVAGVAGALAVTGLLQNLLYGVSATDPATFVVVALLLGAVTLISAYLPARRAARIDPIVALREE